MKFKYIMTLSVAISFLTSCSDIAESDRFTQITPQKVKRSVLIEDFTAQQCIFCPNAIREIERLQKSYGNHQIVAVSIHGGLLSFPETAKNYVGLANETSEYYTKKRGITGQPFIVVNRGNGSYDIGKMLQWVTSDLALDTPLSLRIAAHYDESKQKIVADVEALSSKKLNGILQIWLIEDHIKAPQFLPNDQYQMDFEHNHVLRAAINGLDGQAVALESNVKQVLTSSIKYNKRWVKEHLSVVAFVTNDNGVAQVALASLQQSENKH